MKFIKLKLAAFLSFKDRTEINFAQFGNKLILLFGGSGVGKTAIFDGITFALYGRGSSFSVIFSSFLPFISIKI